MPCIKHIGGTAVLGAAILLGVGLAASPARADFVVTLAQQGSDVVATGSGSIDLTGLTFVKSANGVSAIVPNAGTITLGPASLTPDNIYTGFTGPASFGSGGEVLNSSGSGDFVGIGDSLGYLAVPDGYISGNSLSSTATWDNATFASLGVTPGTYTWTWGSGANADSFTLDVPTAVPEPGSLALLGTAVIGLGVIGWSTKKRRIA